MLKKLNPRILYIIIIFTIISCSDTKQPTEVNQAALVYGVLKINTSPVVGADVQIDDNQNWKTTTNDEGYFEIKNVTKGEHNLKTSKVKENGQLASYESTVSINEGETDLGEILLPIPPLLYEIDTTDVAQNRLKLSWSTSFDNDFREYKLYRKDDPGIDETTGELIFVTTNYTDTVFIDDSFNMGLEYFYRVFVLSAYGKLGGSNVQNANTPKVNIVVNGDFETPSADSTIFNWYSYTNIFSLDSITVYEGKYSVLAKRPAGIFNDWNLNQDIPATKFSAGRTYKFSVMMKSDNTPMGAFIFYYHNGNMNLITTNLQHPEGSDWAEHSTEFQIPPDASTVTVRLWIQKESLNNELMAWFDNVKIELL